MFFPGFEEWDRELVTGIRVHGRSGGSGPPVILLHGHPRAHTTWYAVAPRLVAQGFTVVCPDLRGYGRSGKPAADPDHTAYSDRTMAADIVALMDQLGHREFAVVGHDRGLGVAYRCALDHPERVSALVVLDGVPMAEAVDRADARFATAWWHWFFFAASPHAERVITADPVAWYGLDERTKGAMGDANFDYVAAALQDPATVLGMLEDYRAGLSVDAEHDRMDRDRGHRIACPTLVGWSIHDDMEQLYGDPSVIWRDWVGGELQTARIDSGHHMAEENPEQLATVLARFLSSFDSTVDVGATIATAHHEEWAKLVATLARRFGDLDIAEDAAAEAFATAVQRWPQDGIPPNPGAWLTTTAKRKAIDRLRRESQREDKHRQAGLIDDSDPQPTSAIEDDRLRLIFTCCHPALAMETRVALTLRMVGGLTVPEIARAFLVQETAMGQRITRAKAKIKAAGIPYRVPSEEDLPARLSGVLAVLFLVFNEGYLATGPDTDPVRHELTAEAIRLTRLVRDLVPDDGEVAGLLALMLLIEARGPARVSGGGELVTLAEQDRGSWDLAMISEGHRLVRERIAAREAPGRYQLLAAINAVHTSASDAHDTDWSQVVALYDQLVRLDPSPIVALNRAIAVAELEGPEAALAIVEGLSDALAGYHAYHAARADLLRRLGHGDQARAAYDHAIELAGNSAERAYLTRRRDT